MVSKLYVMNTLLHVYVMNTLLLLICQNMRLEILLLPLKG